MRKAILPQQLLESLLEHTLEWNQSLDLEQLKAVHPAVFYGLLAWWMGQHQPGAGPPLASRAKSLDDHIYRERLLTANQSVAAQLITVTSGKYLFIAYLQLLPLSMKATLYEKIPNIDQHYQHLLKELLIALKQYAKQQNKLMLVADIYNRKLVKFFKENGFTQIKNDTQDNPVIKKVHLEMVV